MKKLLFVSILLLSKFAMAAADLGIQLSGATQLQADSVSSYTINVSNTGNKVVKNGSLVLAIPQGALVTSVSVSGSGGILTNCGIQSTSLVCSLPRVYLGASKAFNILFNLKAPSVTTNMALLALGSHSAADNNSANNSASLSVDVQGPVVIVPPPPVPVSYSIVIQPGDVFHFQAYGNDPTQITFALCNANNWFETDLTFLANGATSYTNQYEVLTYTQPNSSELRFVDRDLQNNGAIISESVGTAISANCFEGVSVYHPPYSWTGTTMGYGAFKACK